MHIVESQDGKFKRYIPENLSECSSQQYIDFCELLFLYDAGQIDQNELLTHSVYKLMGMIPDKKAEFTQEKAVNIVLLQELIQSTFFEKIPTENDNYELKLVQNYIENPVPKFKPLWKTYYGPIEAFQNVKGGEYTAALKLFLQFKATGDVEILYEFVATLYRRKKPFHFIRQFFPKYDGDCRVKYNPFQTEKRGMAFKSAPMGFIYGVYLYFASVQIFVSSAEVPWGDKILDFSILFNGGGETPEIEASDIGLDSVLFAMAESGAFGDFDKIQQLPFWTMMIKMYDSRIKQLQTEKQQENAENKPT